MSTPKDPSPPHPHPILHEAGGAAAGAIAGAAVGAIGGPPGVVVGAVLGGVVGAIITKVSDEEAERKSFHDGELDEAIGVRGGEIGAPNLEHPPAVLGLYSAASSGAGSAGGEAHSAEGPMSTPGD
jgi:hypothetical protein